MKLNFKTVLAALFAVSLVSTPVVAQEANSAASLQDLLQMIRQQTLVESQESRERIREFEQQRTEQQRLLNEANAEIAALERRGVELKDQYDQNELDIIDKEKQLEERLGTLRELFGHLTGFAGDVRETLDLSIVSAQYPGRTDFIAPMVTKMSGTTELPSIAEIRELWSVTLDEIIESGRVTKFSIPVAQPDGAQTTREVVRIGNYNLLSNGEYLSYDPGTGRVEVLPKQPASRYLSQAESLQSSTASFNQVGLDPTGPNGGNFLKAIIATPNLVEKWHQGGQVGYIITGLFGVAVVISLFKLLSLLLVSTKVRGQLKSDSAKPNNPLGRVLKVQEDNPNADLETLELKLNEQILKETPRIEAWINLIKIIAAVAPLMGLLGTVTGMIVVFQGITLFGAGDVQGMAGGISQALVTTVLGLLVAIPTILLHTWLNSVAQRIVHILDEQAAGIVAAKTEA